MVRVSVRQKVAKNSQANHFTNPLIFSSNVSGLQKLKGKGNAGDGFPLPPPLPLSNGFHINDVNGNVDNNGPLSWSEAIGRNEDFLRT